jgi:hypothetical protein
MDQPEDYIYEALTPWAREAIKRHTLGRGWLHGTTDVARILDAYYKADAFQDFGDWYHTGGVDDTDNRMPGVYTELACVAVVLIHDDEEARSHSLAMEVSMLATLAWMKHNAAHTFAS